MRETDTVQKLEDELPALIASTPASAQHRRAAFGVVIVLSAAFVASMPFATVQAARVDAFLAVSQAIVLFAELLTATFLFSQFSIQPQAGLLALASGYVCSALFAFLQTLDFPGAYSPAGIITGTPSGAVWFFFFWRTTFPLGVIAYVLLKDAKAAKAAAKIEPGPAIAITIACVIATTAALTWLLAAGYLPDLNVGATQQPLVQYFAVATWSLNTAAVVLLFIRKRTILDVWLIVAVFVSLPDLTFAILYAVTIRFSVGWYVGKAFLLIGSWTVLVVLLWETMMLYARLAGAMILQRRERVNRMMSVEEATSAIAHELNQPLGALSLNCDAALECLKTAPLDVEELRSCLLDARNDSTRASKIISGVRALFRPAPGRRAIVDVNSLVREILRMIENDVSAQGISITSELEENLPLIAGDRVQLQQVVLNLFKNAIDAVAVLPAKPKAIRVLTSRGPDSSVSILVQDTGPGVVAEKLSNIFDPFITTKSTGMGLGLSISRRIIEDHSGSLRLTETSPKGCTFEIRLPVRQTETASQMLSTRAI